MVCGCMKAKALDNVGEFRLSIPKIETYTNSEPSDHCGTLVYRLQDGCVAIRPGRIDGPLEGVDIHGPSPS